MSKTQQSRKVAVLSILLGTAPGPFVFRAAGFSNFPETRFSHFLILLCYVVGSVFLARTFVAPLLSRTFAWFGDAKPSASPQD